MKITLLERIAIFFIASLMSRLLYLFNILDYEIAYAICAALGFIALVVRLYYKSCSPKVSILKIIFTLTIKLFFGTVITALLLICIQAVIKIDIYNSAFLRAKFKRQRLFPLRCESQYLLHRIPRPRSEHKPGGRSFSSCSLTPCRLRPIHPVRAIPD